MLRVMIIEDEPSAMDRYTGYVENYGSCLAVTARAYTAAEGLDLFRREQPDILFTDIRIPGESGLDLAARFRETGWKGELVIISGYDDFSYARQAIHIAASDYLLKPVFQEDFDRILDRLLDKRRQKEDGRSLEPSVDPNLPEHIARTLQYIELHYEQEINLTDAAAYAYVSPSYLSSSFHRALGETFIEYVRRYRVERARHLLTTTRLPLKVVGEKSGLADPSYFNRSFRKITGMSPGRYRTEHSGQAE